MPIRIPWNQHEVALLIDAYLQVAGGADLGQTATRLSLTLRDLALRSGIDIDGTYRNVNGMKMQLGNVQYLFTDGKKGLSGASSLIREMFEVYKKQPDEFQRVLKEAIQLTGQPMSIEEAFFAYAKDKTGLPPKVLADCLKKAADYCHLKQLLLGMTDVKTVRNAQQKVAEGKLLRFRYGKDAQTIRNVTQLYYNFVKSYHEKPVQLVEGSAQPPQPVEQTAQKTHPQRLAEPDPVAPVVEPAVVEEPVLDVPTSPATEHVLRSPASTYAVQPSDDTEQVDFAQDSTYLFTKPVSYTYRGDRHEAKSWNRLYVEICGLLFADYRNQFMEIMNGDIPGYNALAFADELNYRRMREPKSFTPGYYLESNLDATSIVRKLRGLHRLFDLGDTLQITFRKVEGYQPTMPSSQREMDKDADLTIDNDFDWKDSSLSLVDFAHEQSYAFTQPDAYDYKCTTRRVNKWGKLYADLCGLLFKDYRDQFMTIMNGDIPGYSALAFADNGHKNGMRVARCFTPGYYLESNIDATTIVRRISGLYRLFGLDGQLRIAYHSSKEVPAVKPDEPMEDWIIAQLKAAKIPYVDNRSADGCLWIASDMSIPIPLNEATERGYRLRFKQDGCRAFPNHPVLWTKDQPKRSEPVALTGGRSNPSGLDGFRAFLMQEQHLAERTAGNYWTSIRMIEDYIRRNRLPYSIVEASSENVQSVVDALMSRPDFVRINDERHHQYSAVMVQYVSYLKKGKPVSGSAKDRKQAEPSGTIKDAVVTVLKGASSPMSASDILEQIQQRGLYQFNTDNPLGVVTSTIRLHCVGIDFPDRSEERPFCMVSGDNGRPKFYLRAGWPEQTTLSARVTIKDAVIDVLRNAGEPMSTSAILRQIQSRNLYQFNTENPLPVVLNAIRQNCEGIVDPRLSWDKLFRFVLDANGKRLYSLVDASILSGEGQTGSAGEDDTAVATVRGHILSFVSESFPNGIRPASIIDINKLKRIYQTKIGEEIPDKVDVASLLRSAGLQNGEKVYFLSEDQKQSLRSLITGIIEGGYRVIYYSELLSNHGELYEACHIYESPLMRTVLRNIMPAYLYKAEWMLADRDATEIEEITRAFGEDVVLTYQQLKSRCPYLTMDVIKWALSRSDRFVWSSPETYAQVDLIELDQAEVSDIVNRILPQIRKEGYFSLAQLPIEESCAMNPQVSSSAVRDAIFNRYMSNEFTRNGLIVKLPGIRLNTYELIKTWLKGLDQVTLTEVEDYERELTGHHAVLGIAAASNTMIRIDHDHYVSDASIQFDVEAVDHAISLFAGNRIIPITAITSYTSFPDVPGYNWNLYLVESFLRRFSKRFTIDGGPAQMSYVGGICSADRRFENYEDRLAHAVIQDGVTLTEDAIGRYLTERKYILRRSETVRRTLERARILNEQ